MKFFLLPAFLVIAVSLFSSADGQVTAVTLTIATADRVPFATSKPITVAFTPATALSSGGRITVNYPAGFFKSCVQPVVTGHAVIASSTETGVSSLVLTVNGTLAAAATTVTLVGLTMGGPTAGNSAGITVSTSSDTASSGAASGAIGGQVGGPVTMTIADASRAAGATGKAVTLAFKTTVDLAATDKVTMNYPSGFFAAAVTPTVAPTTLTVGATGATSVILTAGSAIAAGTITVTLSGMTLGAAANNDATGITVSTNKDLVSSGAATGAIGQVTGVTLTIAATDRIAAATTKDVTIAFTLAVALLAADKVTINYPSGFFATSATPSAIKVTNSAGAPSSLFGADGAPGTTSLTIVVLTGQTPGATTHTLVLVGMTLGAATAGSATGISVSAPGNAVSAGQESGPISAIYGVTTSAIAGNTVANTGRSFVFTFQPTVALLNAGVMTITYPNGYFDPSAVPSVAGDCGTDTSAFERIDANTVFGATTFTFKFASGKACAANAAATVTVSGVKLAAAPVMSSETGFQVQATGNAISRGVSIGAIGAAVSSLGTMTIADRTAGATNKAVTLAFTTTVNLAQGDKVTINYPNGFFAAAVTPTVAPTTLTAAATGATSILLTASGAINAGAIEVTLSGLTMGGGASSTSVSNNANGITVTTDKNPIAPTGTATGVLGRVTSVSFSIASTDRVAAATAKDVTIAFTLGVALAAADKVTINYPSGFFATSATPSAIKVTNSAGATSTLFGADGAPGATSLTIVVLALQTPGATTHTLVLVGMTLGAATAGVAASVTVSAPGNAVSTVGADSGAIGGAVSAVSFYSPNVLRAGATNQTVTVTFTTASSTPLTTGRITINYPSGYFATSPTPVVYSPSTIASAAAPTATAIVLSVGGAAIGSGTHTVVLGGLTIGSTAVACNDAGITVNTNVDYSASSALAAATGATGGSPTPAGPNAKKSPASFLYISASFVLAFVFAVLA